MRRALPDLELEPKVSRNFALPVSAWARFDAFRGRRTGNAALAELIGTLAEDPGIDALVLAAHVRTGYRARLDAPPLPRRITKGRARVLELLRASPEPMTQSQVAREIGKNHRAAGTFVRGVLDWLVGRALIERVPL